MWKEAIINQDIDKLELTIHPENVLTKDNVLDYIISAGKVLEEQSVGLKDRWIVLWVSKHRKRRVRVKQVNRRYPFLKGMNKDYLR